MKEVNISESSWHYKYSKFIQDYWRIDVPRDFCTYWANIVLATITFAVIGFFYILVTVLCLSFVALVIFSIANVFGISLIFSIVLILFLAAVTSAILFAVNKYAKTRKHSGDGLFATKYKSWKEKTCHRINFIP